MSERIFPSNGLLWQLYLDVLANPQDSEKWSKLLSNLQSTVYAACAYCDPCNADEYTNVTLEKLYQKLLADEIVDEFHLLNLSRLVARQTVVDDKRRRRREKNDIDLVADVAQSKELEASEAIVAAAEFDDLEKKLDALPDCIDKLPAKYRDAIKLYRLEDLGRKEVAAKLKWSENTLKKRLDKAYLLLFDCMMKKRGPER